MDALTGRPLSACGNALIFGTSVESQHQFRHDDDTASRYVSSGGFLWIPGARTAHSSAGGRAGFRGLEGGRVTPGHARNSVAERSTDPVDGSGRVQFEELAGNPQPVHVNALRTLCEIEIREYSAGCKDPRKRPCNRLAQRRRAAQRGALRGLVGALWRGGQEESERNDPAGGSAV